MAEYEGKGSRGKKRTQLGSMKMGEDHLSDLQSGKEEDKTGVIRGAHEKKDQ